jgi:hypothetical protein
MNSFEQTTLYIGCLNTALSGKRHGLYFLLEDTDGEMTPLTQSGRILLFTQIRYAATALTDAGFEPLSFRQEDIVNYDPCEVVRLIREGGFDDKAVIINFLNLLSDLFPAAGIKLPESYRDDMVAFADHLTFSKELDVFFAEDPVSREHLVNGVIWSVGAVLLSSKFIP